MNAKIRKLLIAIGVVACMTAISVSSIAIDREVRAWNCYRWAMLYRLEPLDVIENAIYTTTYADEYTQTHFYLSRSGDQAVGQDPAGAGIYMVFSMNYRYDYRDGVLQGIQISMGSMEYNRYFHVTARDLERYPRRVMDADAR